VIVDGIRFDSQKEARRYGDLKLMQKAGIIQNLKCQVVYQLSVCKHIADFVYTCDGMEVVEDVKGYRHPVYKMKKKLMLSELNIKIKEI
jgi:hypothetical protein